MVEQRLDNGARILVLPAMGRAKEAVAAVQLWVFSGTAAETPAESGCAHLLEHLLFKPAHLPGGDVVDLTEAIERLGGDINAYTSLDETVIYATVLAKGAPDAVDAIAGAVLHPTFDPEELAAEAEVVVEEIRADADDPSACIAQDVSASLFRGHGYARSVLGSIRRVRAHDVQALRRFHRRAYAGHRLVLVVAGARDPDEVVRRARHWLDGVPAGRAVLATASFARPRRTRASVKVHARDVAQLQLSMGWAAPPLPDAEACALEVAAVVLGYGDSSRIATRLQRGKGLLAEGHATLYGYREASTWSIGARTDVDQGSEAFAALMAEVASMRATGVTREELARAQAVLRSEKVYRTETTAGRAHALGYFLSLGGSLATEDAYFAALDRVSPIDVRNACRRWLVPNGAAVSVVVPRDGGPKPASLRRELSRALKAPRAARRGRRRGHEVDTFVHRSGVQVCLWPDERVPMVAGWWMWPGGQRLETRRTNGWGPLASKLVTRGNAFIEGDALAREIEGRAAVLDGFCGRNCAGVHFECLADDAAHVLSRAAQCVVAPRWTDEAVAEQRRLTLQAIVAQDDDLGGVAVRAAAARLYGRHPYGLRRKGTPESLQDVTAGGLQSWFRRRYPVAGATLGIAGAVERDAIERCLDEVLPREHPRTDAPKWSRVPPRRVVAERLDVAADRTRTQAHVVLAFAGLAMGDARAATLDVLMTVLGAQTGRLFMALREREGLVYHVSASSTEGIDAGDVMVYAATARAKVDRTLAAIEAELRRVCTEPIGRDELRHAKAVLQGEFATDLERRGRLASAIAFDAAFELPSFTGYPRRVAGVRAQDVRELAQTLLDPARQITVVAGA